MRPLPQGVIVPVAGVSWRQDKVSKVFEGQAVVLYHEVNNPNDPWACAVATVDGDILGYVPAQAGLAARLTTPHPGGTWDGVVVEKTGRDTVGLRVRIGAKRDEVRSLVVGEDVEGHWVEDSTSESATPTHSPTAQVAYTLTGRKLGQVVEVSEQFVRVKAGDNTIARYPLSVVTFHPSSKPRT